MDTPQPERPLAERAVHVHGPERARELQEALREFDAPLALLQGHPPALEDDPDFYAGGHL